MSYEPRPDRAVLRGSVRIACGSTRVEAAGAVLDTASGELYAEGPVLLRDDDRRFDVTCESLRYNLRSESGTFTEARVVFFPPHRAPGAGRVNRGEVTAAVVSAAVVTRVNATTFSAENATITSCEFAQPHWRMVARSVEVVVGERMVARGIAVYLGRTPVLYWPRFTVDISAAARYMRFDLHGGSSGLWGNSLLLDLAWPVRRADDETCGLDMWGMSVGHRQTRGWEGGLSFRWGGASSRGALEGWTYFEDATSAATDAERGQRERDRTISKTDPGVYPLSASQYLAIARGEPVMTAGAAAGLALSEFSFAGEARTYVELAHTSALGAGWELDTQLHTASDRGVRLEYLERAAETGMDDLCYVDLNRRAAGGTLSIFSGFRTDAFRTETEYLPELRWAAPVTSLGGGVVLSAETAAGWLRRGYDEALVEAVGATEYEAFRARARAVLWRPMRIGPLTLSPYVGTDQAFYDRSRVADEGVGTGSTLYGASLSTRLYGRFDRAGRPYRHVVELRAAYQGVGEPTENPADLYGFDGSDDLMTSDVVSLGLLQKLQTKRRGDDGLDRSVDLAALYVGAEYYADRAEAELLNAGRRWGRLSVTGFVRPSPGLRFVSSSEWDPNDGGLRASEHRVEFGDALDAFGTNLLRGRWRLGLFQVTSATPGATASNEIGARLALAPAGRWRLELDARYELEPVPDAGPGWTSQRAALVRDFHDWELGIGAWRDPLKDDWGVSVSIVPRGFAANLPTPADYD